MFKILSLVHRFLYSGSQILQETFLNPETACIILTEVRQMMLCFRFLQLVLSVQKSTKPFGHKFGYNVPNI